MAKEPIPMTPAGRIRRRRVIAGLTQEQVALELGITASTLSRYERGGSAPKSWREFDVSHRDAVERFEAAASHSR